MDAQMAARFGSMDPYWQ